jgi:hypothetical protein
MFRPMTVIMGRVITQAVNRWLHTAAGQVRTLVKSCGICGGQSGPGTSFLRVLRFPLPILNPPSAPQSPSYTIWAWYNRPVVAAVPSGLSLTPLRIKIKIMAIIVRRTKHTAHNTGRTQYRRPTLKEHDNRGDSHHDPNQSKNPFIFNKKYFKYQCLNHYKITRAHEAFIWSVDLLLLLVGAETCIGLLYH